MLLIQGRSQSLTSHTRLLLAGRKCAAYDFAG